MDRNPHENRLLAQLDRRRERAPFQQPARPTFATSDALHLVPRKPSPPIIPQQETATMPTVTCRAIKVTCVVSAEELLEFHLPEGGPSRVVLNVRAPDRTVTADIAAKSIRKAQTLIGASDPGTIACVLQGRLGPNDSLLEAGLIAQVKAKKLETAEVAA